VHRTRGRSQARTVVYVAVEGESTEVDYFTYVKNEFLDDDRVTLHVVSERNGLKPQETVDKLVDVGDVGDELWAVFDRDEHHGIPQAFAVAKRAGVNIAFSNPSFDLWLLLHFAAFSGAQSGSSDVVHEKLRKQPGFETFDVRNDKSIKEGRVEALRGKERIASRHARMLVKDCPTSQCTEADGHADHCDPLCRDPSTDVWRLLAALGVAVD
jgi:hypothetical protein